jgi:hypothetical protein
VQGLDVLLLDRLLGHELHVRLTDGLAIKVATKASVSTQYGPD